LLDADYEPRIACVVPVSGSDMCQDNAGLHFHAERWQREQFLHDCNNMGKIALFQGGA